MGISSYKQDNCYIYDTTTKSNKVLTQSGLGVWKHKKPFSDAEIIKEVLDTMFEDKQNAEMTAKIKQIPLSVSTATRHSEILSGDLIKQLCDGIKIQSAFHQLWMIPLTTIIMFRWWCRWSITSGSLLKMCWAWQTPPRQTRGKTFTMQCWYAEWKRDRCEESCDSCHWWSPTYRPMGHRCFTAKWVNWLPGHLLQKVF